MKIARYWTRAEANATDRLGRPFRIRARGWSDENLDAARVQALEIARRVADRVASGSIATQRYPYGDRPLPEPVLREMEGAIVTRNAYGALVLNTEEMMFVDIDRGNRPVGFSGIGKALGSLFKRGHGPDPMVETVQTILASNGLAGRLYQTAAGHRLIITNRAFRAGSVDAETLLGQFGADPLYVRLCRLQESFRARLSPKPWRCDLPQPPFAYPFETSYEQARFSEWEREYNAKCEGFATCRFVATAGSGQVEARFRALIDYHDRETKALTTLALA